MIDRIKRAAAAAASPNLAASAGLGLIIAGCAMIWTPLAFLVAGGSLFGLALWGHLRG